MKTRLMIVDDEPIVRKGIANVINWEQFQVEIVAEASNGRDGLKQALLFHPDIIISDVKMPVMDGIQMARQIREMVKDVQIIMLSGYRDYEYTRQSFKYGVVDYLLKPVSVEALSALVILIQKRIEDNRRKEEKKKQHGWMLHQILPVIRGEHLADFALGNLLAADFVARCQNELSMPLPGPCYQIICLDIDRYQRERRTTEDMRLLLYALSNIAEEILIPFGSVTTCYDQDKGILILLNTDKSLNEVRESCLQIQFYSFQYFKHTVTIGVGGAFSSIAGIRQSYHQAKAAIDGRLLYGENQIIMASNAKEGEESDGKERGFLALEQSDERLLREKIQWAANVEIQELLNGFFEKYLSGCKYKKAAQQFCLSLIVIALQELENRKIDQEMLDYDGTGLFEELEAYHVLSDMQMWVKNLYHRLLLLMDHYRSSQYKDIVKKSMEYARAHYKEKLQASQVAEAVYVTPNYFGKVFKQELGKSFTEWLNEYRIEKAKDRMVREADEKAYQIAEDVGFQDYKYFTFKFKKYTGYTPTMYKRLFGR